MVSLSSRIHRVEAQQMRLPGLNERSPASVHGLKNTSLVAWGQLDLHMDCVGHHIQSQDNVLKT